MATRKIDGWWHVDFRVHRTRIRKRSPANTKGAAEAYELVLKNEIAQHGNLDRLDGKKQAESRAAVPTFREFAERWFREYVIVRNKPSEQNTKGVVLRRRLLPTFGRLSLSEVKPQVIERFTASLLHDRLRPKSVNNYLTVLRTCLITAVEWGVLSAAPRVRGVRVPPPTFRYLSEQELNALLAAAATGVWHAMILTAARTGLRRSELLGLRWEDVDFEHCSLRVCRARVRDHVDSPKNNRVRYVPLTSDVVAALRNFGAQDAGGWVFVSDGMPVSFKAADRHLLATCKRAGVRPIGWHKLRHTFASHLALRGCPLHAVKELLGHSTIEMTMRYAHLNPGALRDAIALLDPRTPSSVPTFGQPVGSESSVSLPHRRLQDVVHDENSALLSAKPALTAG